jgi:cytochrome P450
MGRLRTECASGETSYLAAVIDETLRLRPAVFMVGRHARRPVVMDKWRVDAGWTLAPNIHLLHGNPAIYPEPEEFRPERFLGKRPEPREWMPFGGGIRRCLGASFADLEMRVVIPEVLNAVELIAASPAPEKYRRETVTLVPRNGTRVIARRRAPDAVPQSRPTAVAAI